MSLKLMRRSTVTRVAVTKWLSITSLAWVVFFAGCKTQTENDNTSNTFVSVVNVEAIQGQGTTVSGDDLFSDICDNDATSGGCVVFNDSAQITLRAQPKDLGLASTAVNDVVFERYRVTYIRADGRNVPGVDVPYAFDGVANFAVPADGTTVDRILTVVRQQAKLESPLRELRADAAAPGNLIISTIAEIQLFGRDIAGRSIKVTAFLNITFADFG